jgi:uncharacterized OsmC-like protein
LASDVLGEIETDENVLVLRRIHVTYHLKAEPEKRDVAERVLGFHAEACPLARSISGCVDITTSLELEELE